MDLHEGIESTLVLIQFAIKDGTRIVKEFGDLPEFYCNPGEMNQVFMALLTKAVEVVAKEGVVTIRTSADEKNIRVEIADTGKGIPPETLETIFDLNFRTKDQRVGVGLELTNAYNIIMQHKGDLKVESKIGKGTQFTIVLPDSGISRHALSCVPGAPRAPKADTRRSEYFTSRTEGNTTSHDPFYFPRS